MSISTTTNSGLHCEIWQPQDFTERDNNFSSCQQSPEFFIDLYVSSYTTQGNETVSRVFYKNFRQRCDVLTQDTFSWSAISSLLSETNVPYHLQPFFIQQISTRARGIANEPNNALCQTIPLVVELMVPEEEEELGDESDHIDSNSNQMLRTGLARASRLSMEEMERVEIDDDNGFSSHCCVICLDEIEVGCDAVRMPCLHFYHQTCIVKWLVQSNLCPLCRFRMPIEEE